MRKGLTFGPRLAGGSRSLDRKIVLLTHAAQASHWPKATKIPRTLIALGSARPVKRGNAWEFHRYRSRRTGMSSPKSLQSPNCGCQGRGVGAIQTRPAPKKGTVPLLASKQCATRFRDPKRLVERHGSLASSGTLSISPIPDSAAIGESPPRGFLRCIDSDAAQHQGSGLLSPLR